jgi:hypothetical protein
VIVDVSEWKVSPIVGYQDGADGADQDGARGRRTAPADG